MVDKADRKFMQRALELAQRGRGKTSPNPMVGAIIVKNNRIIGEGYHRRMGADHAEVVALKRAGKAASNAIVYVTLEPCCHTGHTGPCVEALIRAGLKRVVYAIKDPDPRVNGKGGRLLRKAGIDVKRGILAKEAARLNETYIGYHRNMRPFVILKMAQTLDGRIATSTGDSKWITGLPARKFAHQLRSEVDAVVIGMGTVKADNPVLTVRHVKGKNPYRVVVTSSLDFPTVCHLLDNNGDCKTIVATSQKMIDSLARRRKSKELTYWSIKQDRCGLLDLSDFLDKAAAFGFRSMLIEGGSSLATSVVKAGLVDKFVIITAPKLIGEGKNSIGDLEIKKIMGAIDLEQVSYETCGHDMIVIGYPKRKS
jgi:diaminohydroxyphosphoribosylaminopyrimidine deaminase/5-amino-6-(5-phosphoribosylamino)uracil reductase